MLLAELKISTRVKSKKSTHVYLIRCKIRHTHIIKKGEIYQKPKSSVVWEGRPDLSFLFKSCEILEGRGDLSINVEDKKSLRVDCQACKNYALALVLCAFNNSKSI